METAQVRDWIRTHPWTIAYVALAVALAVVFFRQNQNFEQHKRLDRARITLDHKVVVQNCLLLQSRWDIIHEVIVVLLAPNVGDSRQFDDAKAKKEVTLLKALGPRNVCPT